MSRTRALLLAAALLAGGTTAAQEERRAGETDVTRALRAGQLDAALAALDAGRQLTDPRERLAASHLLCELGGAATTSTTSTSREDALVHAVRLLEQEVPEDLRSERRSRLGAAGTALARALLAAGPPTGAGDSRRFLQRLLEAREAIVSAGGEHGPVLRAVAREALPRLRQERRYRDVVAIGSASLAGDVAPDDARALRAEVGMALLMQREYDEAFLYLADFLAYGPTDPLRVLQVVEHLPPSRAEWRYEFLLPVVSSKPRTQLDRPWTECLGLAYDALDHLDRREPPGRDIWERQTERRTFPEVWSARIWRPGFRVWMADDARPGKSSLGKDGVVAVRPVSIGWRLRQAPPAELVRWRNGALCFERDAGTAGGAADGATLAIYWFGPNLQYWYGVTERARGVTGKTVRGHSTGAIARMVGDIVYGEHARRTGQTFRPRAPLPFKLGVAGIRSAWQSGDTIWDETFFSVGQVTCEVLLRIDARDLDLLEPEIRWLYRNVGEL